ncbi:NUDIX hydrolase [Nocardioides sp.]|uniref:NUDIX hydrolase n=1 Tax=Nocardioides sp. TaxID=35761 RepID=UPI002D7FB295|nr:NUDIX domain-containing protein [Nocardioides sp.]HET8959188.1 NUDIX domain-containing protein [Nocardioides sp.]
MGSLPKRQRVAAYAVILRVASSGPDAEQEILLSRLAERITSDELWTLPGGGLDHGEDPRDAVLREVKEETGLDAEVGETARVYSAHLPGVWRDGRRVDAHALRIVYDGWVAPDAPEPRVVEVDGSTAEAAWHRVTDVVDGTLPVAPLVLEALADHQPFRRQRVGAYALVRRESRAADGEGDVLLVQFSQRGFHTGSWSLPGGGLGHGESPRPALEREVREECGLECAVGELIAVHDEAFSGTAPSGRFEDFHAVLLVFAATVDPTAEPWVAEVGGTTEAVAWVPVADVRARKLPVLDVVHHALEAAGRMGTDPA